ELEDRLAHVKNIYVRAEEYEEKIVFLHKVEEGRANESYGIHVAKLADMPVELITRAQTILNELENQEKNQQKPNKALEAEELQLSFFEEVPKKSTSSSLKKSEKDVLAQLADLNMLDMTPMDAMNLLYNLHLRLK